jgi:hypothetical protein
MFWLCRRAKARESVVISQALGAAVTAASILLTRAISERNAALVNQVFDVGLLLHSVSLLSTSGNEVICVF